MSKTKKNPSKLSSAQKAPKLHKKDHFASFILNPKNFPFFLALAIFFVYFNSFFNEFMMNWDDVGYIIDDQRIHQLSYDSIQRIFSEFYMSNYHPLTTLSYALEYSWVGENVFLYHFTNFLLHILNSILVWYLLRSLLPNKTWIAAFSAMVFAVHPMHVESVAWISERKDLLYSLFFILGLIQYQKYLIRSFHFKYLLSALLFFGLSLLSKSAAVIFPIVILLFDYYYSRKIRLKMVLEKIPFFALALLFGILALNSQQGALQNLDPMLKSYERLLIVVYSFITYCWKLFVPLHLSAMYPYPILDNGHLPLIYFLMPLFLFALAFLVFRLRKNKIFAFGMAFFLVNLLLVLQFVPVGGVILSERYTYIPYIGLAISFGILLDPFIQQRKLLSIFLISFWIASLIILANARVSVWKNGDVLFSDVINKYPRLPYAYNNRGFLYWDYYAQKKFNLRENLKKEYSEKAYSDFSMAIALDPQYSEAYLNRAILLYNTGKAVESIHDFDRLLSIDSIHKDGILGRANTYSTLGMYQQALPDYNRYLKHFPDAEAKVWVWRGIALQKLGFIAQATADFYKAVDIDSTYYESFYWLGIINYQKNNFSKASSFFLKAHQRNTENAETLVYLGLCDFNRGDIDRSIEHYSMAIELGSSDLSAFVNRAVSYYQKGMYEQALSDLDFAQRGGFPIDQNFYLAVKSRKLKNP